MSYFDREHNVYNIDKDAHYFFLTSALDPIGLAFGIRMKSSSNPQIWVEGIIDESRYKVDDNYKVTLRALNQWFGSETYYQSDFDSFIESGYIVKKTSEEQHMEIIQWEEPLCGSVVVRHEACVLVGG